MSRVGDEASTGPWRTALLASYYQDFRTNTPMPGSLCALCCVLPNTPFRSHEAAPIRTSWPLCVDSRHPVDLPTTLDWS